MATKVWIDAALIDQALRVSGEKSRKTAVRRALEEFIALREQKKILELLGRLEWDGGYDYKADRSR